MSGGLLVNLKSSAAPHPTIPRVSAFTAVSDSPDGSKSHLSGQRCLLHQVLLSKFLRIFFILFSTCFGWKPRFNQVNDVADYNTLGVCHVYLQS